MSIRSLLAAGLLVLGSAVVAVPTSVAGPRPSEPGLQIVSADEISAAKRKKSRRGYNSYGGGQIACTRFGCGPIPRGCQIVGERTWDGAPSGFDAVVCPYR